MIHKTWYPSLVGHKAPEIQNVLQRMKNEFQHEMELEHAADNPVDPNAVHVMAILPGEDPVVIGFVTNRSRCWACDPDGKTFGNADYEHPEVCPRCGEKLTRGVATQICEEWDNGRTVNVRLQDWYTTRKGDLGMSLFVWSESRMSQVKQ